MVMHIRGLVGVHVYTLSTTHSQLLITLPSPDPPAAAPAGRLGPRPLRQTLPAARPPEDQQEKNQGSPPHLQSHLQPDGSVLNIIIIITIMIRIMNLIV